VRLHGGASVSRDVIPWPLLVGVHGSASSGVSSSVEQGNPPQVQASTESD